MGACTAIFGDTAEYVWIICIEYKFMKENSTDSANGLLEMHSQWTSGVPYFQEYLTPRNNSLHVLLRASSLPIIIMY